VSRTAVNCFLVVYLVVVWSAALAKFDKFPLTWVSMYAFHEPSELLSLRVSDPVDIDRGMLATALDGSTRYVTRHDLNVTKRHFKRLYRQRMFDMAPSRPWPQRILMSLNRTFGYRPGDPKFIVRLEADIEQVDMRKTDLEVVERRNRHASHEWTEETLQWWDDDDR